MCVCVCVSYVMTLAVRCCFETDMNYRSKASVSIHETQPITTGQNHSLVLCLLSDSEERLVND